MPSKQKSPDAVVSESLENSELGDAAAKAMSQESPVEASKKEGSKPFSLKLSNTLVRKLTEKAQVEGVSVDDFASELLAEGLVLRAWEIVEKKGAMRSSNGNNSGSQNSQNFRSQKLSYRNQSHHMKRTDSNHTSKNYSRQNYKNIMDDNANFLEYVRNQEKRDRY